MRKNKKKYSAWGIYIIDLPVKNIVLLERVFLGSYLHAGLEEKKESHLAGWGHALFDSYFELRLHFGRHSQLIT